jgi:hypothetical protein
VKKFNTLSLGIMLALSACAQSMAFAAQSDDDKTLQEQASEFKVDGTRSITTQDLILEAMKSTSERDEYRDKEEVSNLRRKMYDAELDALESEKKLEVELFIKNNVPDYIVAAGEKAINAFILENFVDRDKNNPSSGKKIEKVWGSTDSALTAPQPVNVWEPVVTEVKVVDESYTEGTEGDESTEEGNGMTASEEKALSELGMTKAELEALMGGGSTQGTTPPTSTPDTNNADTNVFIIDIEVSNVAVMGMVREADISIEMSVVRSGEQRKVTRKIREVTPGYMFEVEGSRFEVISINQSQIIIENIDTGKTHREIINS